jgi:hypothetical protein
MTHLWEFIERNRENVEALDRIRDAVEYLEHRVEKIDGDGSGVLTEWGYKKEEEERRRREKNRLRDPAGLVRSHEATVSNDVCRQNRRQPSLHTHPLRVLSWEDLPECATRVLRASRA